MKRRERSWMYKRTIGQSINPDFVKGVDEFIRYVKDHPESSNPDEVRCPCVKWEGYPGVPERRSNEYREMVFDAFGHSQDQGHSKQASVSSEEEPNATTKQDEVVPKKQALDAYEQKKAAVPSTGGDEEDGFWGLVCHPMYEKDQRKRCKSRTESTESTTKAPHLCRHLGISLDMLVKLVRVFGSVIYSAVSASSSVGVDIEAEQRLERCNLCYIELERVKLCLPALMRRGGSVAKSAQELNLALSAACE